MEKISDVYLICGFLGAGKTTCSKKLAQDIGAVRLNVDEVCMQKYTPAEYEKNWELCFSQTLDFLWQKTAEYIKQGKDVIFDVGFWSKASRDEAVQKIKQLGGNPIIYYIYAPDEILKQRISTRSGKIAEHNLSHFDDIKKYFEEPSAPEHFIKIDNF